MWVNMSKNYESLYTLGSSILSDREREKDDFYATEPRAVELLLENIKFVPEIYEPACGMGHISKVLLEHGYSVVSSDLIYRGFGIGDADFLKDNVPWNGDIITNPPYKMAIQFIEHALSLVNNGNKVAMLLRLQFLESKRRYKFFKENPPRYVYVHSSRVRCAINGDFEKSKDSNAVAYAWFVWEKGYKGKPEIEWLP